MASTLLDDAKKRLGELLITGIQGLELSDDTSAFLSQAKIGGVYLNALNFQNPGQLAELTNQIQECRGTMPLFVCVSQEGGRGQAFKKPFTKLPEASAVGKTDSPKLAFDLAEAAGKELKSVGINVNFAPVADIATNSKNQVLESRCFGSNEEDVSKLVTATVRGYLVSEVQPRIKHFPGHGDTSTDSNFALPRIDTPLEVLRDREFKPFTKSIKSRGGMILVGHLLLTKVDPKYPASLSRIVLQDILRTELRYSRLIVADDLEMKAITDNFNADEVPVLALNAGCDLLFYRNEAGARHAYEASSKALDAQTLKPETVIEASERIQAYKKDALLPYRPISIAELQHKLGTPETQSIVQKIEEASASR